MKKSLILLQFISVLIFSFSGNVNACSTFALIKGNNILICNNDDWFCNVAYFTANPRGVTKQTFLPSADNRLKWTSKYGSITINFNSVLENISQQSTMFSWIYDITNRTIYYKTAWESCMGGVSPKNTIIPGYNNYYLSASILSE